MRVLVFGDSIAQGFWSVDGGWVEKLRKHYDKLALEDLVNNKQPEIFNLGVSGDTTRNLLARIELETRVRTWPEDPLTVVLAIGTNDELFENNEQAIRPEEFKANVKKILKLVRPLVDKIMFVGNAACDEKLTTPVFWSDIHYTNNQLKNYEDYIKEIAQAEGVPFAPIFERFQAEQQRRNLLADGLHPNDEGHELIYQIVRPELDMLLGSKT